MAPPSTQELQSYDFDALLVAVRDAPDSERLREAWWEAVARVGLRRGYSCQPLALPESLTPDQRRLADALAARDDLCVSTCGIPGTPRLLRRWLGLTPPSVLERRVPWTHEGAEVSWPLWKLWLDAPDASLEYGQGIAAEVAERLNPAEMIEAAGEAMLEPYGLEAPYGDRLGAALVHAADALPWARRFVGVLLAALHEDGTWAPPYEMTTDFRGTLLGTLTLLPFVRAGVAIDPAWDRLVPHEGEEAVVRELLMALPEARREAVVWHRLTTTWGPRGDEALNGFWENLRAAEFAPSLRNLSFVVRQLRNCRRYFAPSREKIMARIDALIEAHPELAPALAPQRKQPAAKKSPAKKSPAKKSPAKKSPAKKSRGR